MAKKKNLWIILMPLLLTMTGLSGGILEGEARADDKKAAGVVVESPREFVERHVSDFRKRLTELRARYQDCCGSAFASLSPGDAASIALTLPKPSTIQIRLDYPAAAKKDDPPPTIEAGDYLVNSIGTLVTAPPAFSMGYGYYNQEEGNIVAADAVTSELIAKPNLISARPQGSLSYIAHDRTEQSVYCCTASKTQDGYKSCTAYFYPPYRGYVYSTDLLPYTSQISLSQSLTPGVQAVENMRTFRFSQPGKKEITYRSPRAFGDDDSRTVYRSCIADLSCSCGYWWSYCYYGVPKVVVQYKPAGNIEYVSKFRAVSFKKFGFLGYDIDANYGKAVDLDFFFDARNMGPGAYNSYLATVQPVILLDYGDAGGLKAVPASELNAPVTWTTLVQGPIFVNDGNIQYSGGFGATKFRVALGGQQTVEREATANAVDIVSETIPGLRGNGLVALGRTHKVVVRVKGGAEMSRYKVSWTSSIGSWSASSTSFRKVGDEWQSEGEFSIPAALHFATEKPARIRVAAELTRTSDGSRVYAFENDKLAPGYPAASKLALHMWTGKDYEPVTSPVDLFIPGSLSYVVLVPYVTIQDGSIRQLREVNRNAGFETTCSDPSIVGLVAGGLVGDQMGRGGVYAAPVGNTGVVKVAARLGGADIDPSYNVQTTGEKKELVSDPLTLQVNQLFSFVESQGNTTRFKLLVSGPSDMTGYQALWLGEGRRTTPFVSGENGYATVLSTTLRIDKVQIIRGDTPIAELSVNTAMRGARVKLIPPNPPVMKVNQSALPDVGSLESITECKKNVTSWVQLFGFDPKGPIEDYCRSSRERDKDEILAQRAQQKDLNLLVRDLKRQGQELVVLGDTMEVGAAIKGDLVGLGDSVFCYWTLIDGGGLRFASELTPIERASDKEGGCFNQVTGLKGGFNPNAQVRVDLVWLQRSGLPIVSSGGRVVQTTW